MQVVGCLHQTSKHKLDSTALIQSYRSDVVPDLQAATLVGPGDMLVYQDTKKLQLLACKIVEKLGANTYLVDREVMLNSMQVVMILPE